MSGEGFFRRWARLKSAGEGAEQEAAHDAAQAAASAPPAPTADALAPARSPATPVPHAAPAERADADATARPLPTLEDAARLTPDADFSAFVARDVDKSVQRLALKKLFADPHFNAMDGLDMYMSDYNQPSPMSPAMLASLKHAPKVLADLFGDKEEQEDQQAPGQHDTEPPHTEAVAMQEQGEPALNEPAPSTRQGNA